MKKDQVSALLQVSPRTKGGKLKGGKSIAKKAISRYPDPKDMRKRLKGLKSKK